MLNFKDFNAIENKYPTNKILFKGICIWSYLRIYAYDKAHTGSGTAQNASSVSKSILIKSLLWQLPKLGKFETLVLSSSDQRKWIDNLWYDRFDFHPELKEKVIKTMGPLYANYRFMLGARAKGEALYDKFNDVIRFEKHKNFSRIAE